MTVTFDGVECVSSSTEPWSGDQPIVEVVNESDGLMALIFGTYDDGYSHSDFDQYAESWVGGEDRPDFVEAVEILEVEGSSERNLTFIHGRGRYAVACMAQPETLIALDDVVVGD